jgi:outer membrane lipoprotein LolB
MRCFATAVILLVLSGCASAPPVSATLRTAQPAQSAFTLNGRISVKYDGERSTANLHWKHLAGDDDVLLLAPLGMTMAHIQRNEHGAAMDASGRHYTAHDSSELMQQVLGWHLPLDGLQYWVLALPRPGAESEAERDAEGRINLLYQDGWTIRYTRYAAQTPDSLPLRLTLQHEGVDILLLVDEWQIQ